MQSQRHAQNTAPLPPMRPRIWGIIVLISLQCLVGSSHGSLSGTLKDPSGSVVGCTAVMTVQKYRPFNQPELEHCSR
jgi:hypothetical protein